jgi:hypothetical protein
MELRLKILMAMKGMMMMKRFVRLIIMIMVWLSMMIVSPISLYSCVLLMVVWVLSRNEEMGELLIVNSHDMLVKPLPAGCRLTAIFDSCHSGTVMDLPYVVSRPIINLNIRIPQWNHITLWSPPTQSEPLTPVSQSIVLFALSPRPPNGGG